jgi:two-component system NtrC family sensor kinase
MRCTSNRRVLVVDDNAAIHEDFRKVLAAPGDSGLAAMEAALFATDARVASAVFEIDSVYQGHEAVELVTASRAAGAPYALAFVDMRMPPGWDGLETIERIWAVDPDIQIVICSAYSDHPWSELRDRLGDRDALLILKKPFELIEVLQCAHALTAKWNLQQCVRAQVSDLEAAVRARTLELELSNQQLAAEVRQRDQLETDLRLAQKLEGIGQLAAGIAHEISTPVQFLSCSLDAMRESAVSIGETLADYRDAVELIRMDPSPERVEAVARRLDLTGAAALIMAMPGEIDLVEQGVERIATIVRAMRVIAHPGSREPQPADLNTALAAALQVTSFAYRGVADLEAHYGVLPAVPCYASDLGQVFVNLIVNAAHAMGNRGRGRLGVTTSLDGDAVLITISDTGCGISPALGDAVFGKFFTTKSVGVGTGQGLAISRAIVVDRHGGSLTYESQQDVGTQFHIRLPVAGPQSHRVTGAIPTVH